MLTFSKAEMEPCDVPPLPAVAYCQ